MDLFDSSIFRDRVTELAARYNVPGVNVAVFQNDHVASASFGVASRQSDRVCVPATLFDIASCSKSFTAAAVALLVADTEKYSGIDWTTPVAQLLPEDFVLAEPNLTKEVTLEDILSHRTGLGR